MCSYSSVLGRAADSTELPKAVCVRALKGLVLPRASHSGKSTLAGPRRLRSTLAAAPVVFADTAVTEAKKKQFQQPQFRCIYFVYSCSVGFFSTIL